MYQTRPGRVALFAVLTELVVIIAVGNQAATRVITRQVGAAPTGFANHALDSLRTFSWRFSPLSGVPAQHAWGAQFAGIGAVALLTYLTVLIISRRAGIGQTFVGTWAGVVAATVVGVVVRGLVYPFPLRGGSRLSVAVFGFPNGAVTFFGFALGLVVALVATLAMIITRKPVAAPADEASQAVAEPGFFDAAPGGYLAPGAGGYEQPPPFDAPMQRPVPTLGGYGGGGYAGYPPAPHDSPATAGPDSPPVAAAPEYSSAPAVSDAPPAPQPTETITPYTGGEQRTSVLPEVPTQGESQSAEPGPDAGQHRHN
ncbi:MAG TPA: hypothetical protein VFN75_12155 [Pseudonocardiaceae bacterium]|nr:hypothetical protein [Pseudonocardiaceae bacterium]